MPDHMIVRQAMRFARKQMGLNQAHAGELLDLSVQAISDIERGKYNDLQYQAIEEYANKYGNMPIGIFLLTTRIVSLYRDGKSDDVVALREGLKAVTECLESNHDEFKNMDFAGRGEADDPERDQVFKKLWDEYLSVGLQENDC